MNSKTGLNQRMHKYQKSNIIIKLLPGRCKWDEALSYAHIFADDDYFADAIAWTASMRNSRQWANIFGSDTCSDLERAIDLANENEETVGFQQDRYKKLCALIAPRIKPEADRRDMLRAAAITEDFARLTFHYPWVNNIRVTQFARLRDVVANREIIRGFLGTAANTARPNHRTRWLVDIEPCNVALFDGMLKDLGATPVDPNSDPEAIGDLQRAIKQKDLRSVQNLLDRGIALDQVSGCGLTALMMAIQQDLTEIVEALIDHGADVNVTNSYGETAFIIAAQEGNISVATRLLDCGGNQLDMTLRREDALMFAANYGHMEMVRFLLDKGCDPGRTNEFGHSAADFAEMNGFTELSSSLKTVRR